MSVKPIFFALDGPNLSEFEFMLKKLDGHIFGVKVGLEMFISEGPKIVEKYRKLAIRLHPDKNQGSEEATSDFQKLLKAYHVAGEAAESVPVDPDDRADQIARKLFQ